MKISQQIPNPCKSKPKSIFWRRTQKRRIACTPPIATASENSVDEMYMTEALLQAKAAFDADEVPVGAVLVHEGTIIAKAYNQTHNTQNPIAHAEMLCIMQAANKLQAWRLSESTLYVTLEPCPMCAGAILQARLKRLVYGARQPRLGADGSWVALLPSNGRVQENVTDSDALIIPNGPHPFHVMMDIKEKCLAEECRNIVVEFFRKRRLSNKKNGASSSQIDDYNANHV